MNRVGIMVVKEEEIVDTLAGDDRELASLIGVGFDEIACGDQHRASMMAAQFKSWVGVGVLVEEGIRGMYEPWGRMCGA
jgi:hypothetical protein